MTAYKFKSADWGEGEFAAAVHFPEEAGLAEKWASTRWGTPNDPCPNIWPTVDEYIRLRDQAEKVTTLLEGEDYRQLAERIRQREIEAAEEWLACHAEQINGHSDLD